MSKSQRIADLIGFINRLILTISTSMISAGNTIVHLKNGQNYAVKTNFGRPVLQSNEYFEVRSIRPSFDQIGGWRKMRILWRIDISFNKELQGTISLDSPLASNIVHTIPFFSQIRHSYHTVLTLEIMERDNFPSLWEWMNEPGDSWIPFHFKINSKAFENSMEFMDWAKITETDKIKARQDFKKILEFESKFELHEIKSLKNEKIFIKFLDQKPVRFANDYLQIDSLYPSKVMKKGQNAKHLFVLVLSGRYIGGVDSLIEISAPSIDSKFLIKAKLKGRGVFTIPFAISDAYPEFWNWLDTSVDAWMPIRIVFHREESEQPIVFIEWVHFDDATRARLRKVDNQTPSS